MLDVLLARHLALQCLRIAFAGFLVLALAGAGAALLRTFRVSVESVAERLILQIAIGFAAYQCIVRWLAELPLVSPAGVLAIVAAFALAGCREWKRIRDDIRDLSPLRGWPAVAVLLLSLPALWMALAPAVSKDAMVYHLRFPEMTLREGRWAYDLASSASFYPAAMGTLYLPALAVDGQGVVAQLLNFAFYLLTVGTVAMIARRLGAPTGGFAAVLCAAVPANAIVAGWAWADAPLMFALASAALALLAARPEIALVLLGLAASIKYTTLAAGLPLACVALFLLVRTRDTKRIAAGIALGLLTVSPWFVTNAIHTGNPIYPLADSSQPTARIVAQWNGSSWTRVWQDYFFRPQSLDEDIGGTLFLLVAAVAIPLALARRDRMCFSALIALSMWLPFLPMMAPMRLLLPAVLALLAVAGAALEESPRPRLATALVAIFAIRGGLVAASHNDFFFQALPAATGIEPEEDYLRRKFPPAALYARAERELPANARVLAINEVRLFRFPRPVTASRVVDPPALRPFMTGARDVPTVAARLRRAGITHLLVATHPSEGGSGSPMTHDEAILTRALIHESRIVDREGAHALFQLP